MTTNGNSEIPTMDLSEIQSQLESFGKEYWNLVKELAHLTLISSTQPTNTYQKLKSDLDYGFTALISAMRSISQQIQNARQSVASAPSMSKSSTSGKTQEWSETLSDSWTTYYNTLLTMHQTNLKKLDSLLKGKDL